MTHRSIETVQLALLMALTSAGFGFGGGLAAGGMHTPPAPPPAFCPPAPPPVYYPPPPTTVCPACPVCPEAVYPRRGVLFTATGFPEYGSGYETARLGDGDPSSYWCSPVSPTFPMAASLMFESPSIVEAVEIDNRISGYETSGAREVRIEVLDLGGEPMRTDTRTLSQATVTSIPVGMELVASGIRVVVLSNFGGEYAGIAEVVVHASGPE
jgi:hypothetical protein